MSLAWLQTPFLRRDDSRKHTSIPIEGSMKARRIESLVLDELGLLLPGGELKVRALLCFLAAAALAPTFIITAGRTQRTRRAQSRQHVESIGGCDH